MTAPFFEHPQIPTFDFDADLDRILLLTLIRMWIGIQFSYSGLTLIRMWIGIQFSYSDADPIRLPKKMHILIRIRNNSASPVPKKIFLRVMYALEGINFVLQ
jgi:hypothetical protein